MLQQLDEASTFCERSFTQQRTSFASARTMLEHVIQNTHYHTNGNPNRKLPARLDSRQLNNGGTLSTAFGDNAENENQHRHDNKDDEQKELVTQVFQVITGPRAVNDSDDSAGNSSSEEEEEEEFDIREKFKPKPSLLQQLGARFAQLPGL